MKSMHYVYMIKSTIKDCLYVGLTDDLRRRFREHNGKENISTKFYAPFELVYYEAYRNKQDALLHEKKLKHHGAVIGHLKRRLKYSLQG